jgi:ADP-ribosylglycohydrolase
MTLFSVEGIIRMLTRTDTEDIATTADEVQRAYWRWYDTQVGPFDPQPVQPDDGWLRTEQWLYSRRAPGHTCLTALQASRSQDPRLGGTLGDLAARNNSKGCGTVMRAAPFGFLPLGESRIWEISCEAAAFTHGHPTGQHAAGALSLLIWHLAHGVSLDHAVDQVLSFVAEIAGAHETVAAIVGAVAATRSLPVSAETVESLGEAWVAEEALAIALYAALVYPEAHQVREALALSVTHSGDSDSTGSICGNILGAAHGVTAIPAELIDGVEGRSTILQLADELWMVLARLT